MSEEPQGDEPRSTAEVVGAWDVPEDATRARRIQAGLLAAIRQGYEDPQLVADLAVGPLVITLGKLEVELDEARRRIAELERALGARDS